MAKILIIVLLACVAYANSLHAPFVFDDLASVQHNREVHFFSLNPHQLLHTRSLLYGTYAFNEWLDGENVFGYHVVNLLLHILNGLLVFGIARKIYEGLRPSTNPLPEGEGNLYALLAAALFVVHPIQTEAVTYITERSELLSKLCVLCGVLFFVKLPEKKIGFFAALPVLFLLVLGLGFKETAIVLPVLIVLYDYLFLAKAKIRNMLPRWRFYLTLAFAGGAGAYAFSDVLRQPVDDVGNPGALPRWPYFLTSMRGIARYLRLVVFPTGQNLDYDFPQVLRATEPAFALSALLILGLLALAWIWRTRRPVYALSICWIFIAIVPITGIVPIPDVIAEHRLYLAMAGVCLSFPFLMARIASFIRFPVVRVASAVLAILLVGTIARNYVWADSIRLFSDVVAKSPHKLRGYENLIFEYMKRGQEDRAIPVVNAGLENVPQFRIRLLDTMGNLYLRMGRATEAVEYYKKSNDESVRLGAPRDFLANSFNNLGIAYMALAKNAADARNPDGRAAAFRNARDAFQKSLDRGMSIDVLDGLVNVNQALGESVTLENELRKKLGANPNDFNTLYMLATLLSVQDRYPESVEYFRRAEAQFRNHEMVHFNYAFALSRTGQIDRAISEYLDALRLFPTFNEAHYNLALIYIQKADYPSALQHLNQIVGLESANVRANLKLAEIYAFQGQLPLARQHLQRVLKAAPQDREALTLFARIGG